VARAAIEKKADAEFAADCRSFDEANAELQDVLQLAHATSDAHWRRKATSGRWQFSANLDDEDWAFVDGDPATPAATSRVASRPQQQPQQPQQQQQRRRSSGGFKGVAPTPPVACADRASGKINKDPGHDVLLANGLLM
jgi:hypothetical protein